ncbi:MAG: PVC-type heme-binding CxxCH protein [Planctomycetota bacterium]
MSDPGIRTFWNEWRQRIAPCRSLGLLILVLIGPVTLAKDALAVDGLAEDGHNHLPKKQHKDSDAPFLKPAEAVAKMSIPEGFEVSVFASEPDIAEPIAFCFDDRGRLWVAENFNYQTRRQHTDDPVSRIQILEDKDGDGVFDEKKTFTDKLTFTSGLACGFGGVFVGSPPNLTFIPDADGDDVPDGPPQVLLDGWGIRDRHETLNSFIWGPDGWLYGCHGVFTHSNVGKPGDDDSQRQFIDAGIWRYHPTRKTFEIFARGLSNSWGFDFNDHGQGFATCCVIPHLFHVVQGGTYHKQSRPHVNPYVYDDIKTIRDHTHLSAHGGARFYLADAFPKQYRDRLFMCNIHEHAVLTDIMEPKGSSFIGKHGDDFMPTNDLAWVGFSVEIGPEGGVYLLDWHDQDICGNAVKFAGSGRVYRIMPKGAKAEARPNLGAMSDIELAELQWHSNDWYVRQARTLLQYRASTGKLASAPVHSKLNEMFGSASKVPKKLRAMWALHVSGGLSKARLVELLGHEDEYVRAWAIQFLCDPSTINAFQPKQNAAAMIENDVLERFASMAKTDPSPIVRLYLASAIQRMPYANRWSILEGLVSHAEDVSDNNLPRMYWFALEPMVPLHQRQSLELAVAGKIPALQEFVARRLVTGDSGHNDFNQIQPTGERDRIIQTVAKGMRVTNVGEGGVVRHEVFRNRVAVQTHPLDRKTPCVLSNNRVDVPQGKKTSLKLRVSHHPHGDWQLRVLADGEVVADRIVSAETVGSDEWLDVTIDLSGFAGRRIPLVIENRANNWHNEWAYWNQVNVVIE